MPIRVEPNSEILPGYSLIERLGGGGFGEVWKATAPGGLHKAIKIVHGDMDTIGEESQRADQELRALRRVTTVRHPYVLSLERFDIVEGRLIIVMELADRNLWDRFKECRNSDMPGVPREELLRYMEETAEALDLMNIEYKLQHLDIKPQNLFLVYNHVKVADFGLVKDLKDRVAATVTGGVTPVYAAPETFDGWVSRYCDQYSLAIVYQEMLTGKRPFSGTSVHQLVMQHVQEPPNLSPLPPEDRKAIARSLAKVPEERFSTCQELVRELRAAGTATVVVPATPPSGAFQRPAEPAQLAGDSGSPTPISPPGSSRPKSDPNLPGGEEPIPAPVTTPTQPGAGSSHVARPFPTPPPPPGRDARPQGGAAGAPAAVETKPEGELFPTLVIGVGQAGLHTLRHLRQELQQRYGPPDTLPSLRLLYLDTDLQGPAEATDDTTGASLSRGEVVVARLNRASFYLKPRQGRPRIDTWFDMAMLYRIQRNEETGGVRALGRLAFFGNYRPIALRLQTELVACCEPGALATAVKNTGLDARSTCPRVYVVASLAGGTGGGMFIDLAYVVRDQLSRLGHPGAEVVGLFFLPTTDPENARPMALGNAYAALTELNHFAAPDVTYSARFDEREGPIVDAAPPFHRCVFLASSPEAPEATDLAPLAGEYLCLETTTAVGRAAEVARTAQTSMLTPGSGMACQSFGLYRYTWPRRALLQRGARGYCRLLVQRWMAKDNKPAQEAARALVNEKWAEYDVDAQGLILRFQETCARALGQGPETAFAAITQPLVTKEGQIVQVGAAGVQEALKQIERLVGQPAELSYSSGPAALEEALRGETETIIRDWQPKLDKFTFSLVEQPSFRLAGAEEALRQTIRLIEKALTQHETLCQELTDKAAKAYDRLQWLLSNFGEITKGGRKGAQLLGELTELLKLYPKWRYQSLILRRVNYTFTSLRGHLSDQVREIGFFRLRLGELVHGFQRPGRHEFSSAPGRGALLFPPGCANLEEAVNELVPELSPEEMEAFDRSMQHLLERQFRSLKYVCTTSAHLIRNLEEAMLTRAEAFVAERLKASSATAAFFDLFPEGERAQEGVAQAFEGALPNLVGPDGPDTGGLALVSVPGGEEGRFARLASQALFHAQVHAGKHADDLIFYREDGRFGIGDLEVLGAPGEEAYQQMCAAAHFTPHTRLDVHHWRPATPRHVEQ